MSRKPQIRHSCKKPRKCVKIQQFKKHPFTEKVKILTGKNNDKTKRSKSKASYFTIYSVKDPRNYHLQGRFSFIR
ncbi:MAG: hypothetical protein DRN08_07535 [Thermoplasmata archaeon]|nr:MAG: hypothetical protein DRN08_07535 [Thermoplasmata archaeon]